MLPVSRKYSIIFTFINFAENSCTVMGEVLYSKTIMPAP